MYLANSVCYLRILHVLHTGTDLPFELHGVWFSEGSAVLLIERGKYTLELEHRSFSPSLVEGYLVIQAVHIRKNRALKNKNKKIKQQKKIPHTCTTTVLWGSGNLFKDGKHKYNSFKTCMIAVARL